jgi:hypothetical protein
MFYEYLIYWLDTKPDLGEDYYKVVRPNSVASEHVVKDGMPGLRLAEENLGSPGRRPVYRWSSSQRMRPTRRHMIR